MIQTQRLNANDKGAINCRISSSVGFTFPFLSRRLNNCTPTDAGNKIKPEHLMKYNQQGHLRARTCFQFPVASCQFPGSTGNGGGDEPDLSARYYRYLTASHQHSHKAPAGARASHQDFQFNNKLSAARVRASSSSSRTSRRASSSPLAGSTRA